MSSFAPITMPILIGALLNFFFFGILLVQVYVYYTCFPKDALKVKGLVDISLNASDISFWLACSFGNPLAFLQRRFAKIYTPIFGSIVSTIVHLCFCYRIYVIKRSAWPVYTSIALIAITQLAGGLAAGIIFTLEDNGYIPLSATIRVVHERIPLYLWLSFGAAADLLIAIVMAVLLSRKAMHDSTRNIVNDLTRLIIETNAFSAAFALIALFLFVFLPDTEYCLLPGFALSAIYANTLLFTLNHRAVMRTRADGGIEDGIGSSHSGVRNYRT
ncbi:hypothetical protein R3P38DRAFT_3573888 [Favolaschia claudopus]|uniref:DUF6534 domain-containing protein n=1 Tax=Favolaschia claudopus TaxID=2862362 RepID=A0AAW0ANS9_9AGAR